MPDTVPATYAQSAIRLLARPRAQMETLLSEIGLPLALLDDRTAAGPVSRPSSPSVMFTAFTIE